MSKEFYCEDYTRNDGTVRKGCGARIKLIKDQDGKTHRMEAVEIPCRDREGNLVYAFVPHFLTCPSEADYAKSFLAEKIAKEDAYQKSRENGQGGQPRGNGFRGQGQGRQGGGGQGGGYRGGNQGSSRYTR